MSGAAAGRAALLIALALVGTGCGVLRLGNLQPPEGRKMVVLVEVEGNDFLSDSDITSELYHKPEPFEPTSDKTLLDRSELEEDVERIKSLYWAHGHFEAQAYFPEIIEAGPYSVNLRFRVEEGPPTRVGLVTVSSREVAAATTVDNAGRRLTSFREEWRDLIQLEKGDVWTEEKHKASKEALTRALYQRGFAYAHVFGDVLVDREKHSARVAYHVVPGPLTRMSELVVVGLKEVPRDVVEARVDLHKWDVIVPEHLKEAEQRLLALGVFASARVEIVKPTLQDMLGDKPATLENVRAIDWPREVPVRAVMQETEFQEVKTGVGLEIDSIQANLLIGRPAYSHRNFFGGQRFFSVAADPKLVFFYTNEPPVDFAFESRIDFRQPRFLEEYITFTSNVGYELDIDSGFGVHIVRGGVGLFRTELNNFTVKLGYDVEYYRFPTDLTLAEGVDPAELGFDVLQGGQIEPDVLLTALKTGVTFDYRDDILETREGVYLELDAAFSVPTLGSSSGYIKVGADLRGYVTPIPWLTIAARFRGGAIFQIAEGIVPRPARFMAGGASSMRGYGTDQMGPQKCRNPSTRELYEPTAFGCVQTVKNDDGTTSTVEGATYPIGGNLLLMGSFELRFRMTDTFGLVTFVDIGQLWAELDGVDSADIRYAPGLGLRIFTPVGAIRFDGAVRLAPDIGEPAFVGHFSLGQAF